MGAESDFGAGRIYAFRAGVSPEARPVIEQIGQVLAPLGIADEKPEASPGPDIGPFAALGMPWAELAQDGTDYFDSTTPPTTRSTRSSRKRWTSRSRHMR